MDIVEGNALSCKMSWTDFHVVCTLVAEVSQNFK